MATKDGTTGNAAALRARLARAEEMVLRLLAAPPGEARRIARHIETAGTTRTCPQCLAAISFVAPLCTNCGHETAPLHSARVCPKCFAHVDARAAVCVSCGLAPFAPRVKKPRA